MNDKQILRKLANEYFTIANSQRNQNNILAHKNVNDLKGQRPIVLISEIPWHEMNIDNELTLYCENPYLRGVEYELKRTIYSWRHMLADMVVMPYFGIGKIIHSSGNGFDYSLTMNVKMMKVL